MAISIAKDELKSYVERIVRLEEEKAELASDIKEVYGEAQRLGYNTKALRVIVKIAMTEDGVAQYEDQKSVLDTYLSALGMLATTPLGEAALKRDIGRALGEARA